MKLVVLGSKLLFSLHILFCPPKSYVSLFTSLFPPIIQDWNKSINVIYFRQHFFSYVLFKYMFEVNISLFFFNLFLFI